MKTHDCYCTVDTSVVTSTTEPVAFKTRSLKRKMLLGTAAPTLTNSRQSYKTCTGSAEGRAGLKPGSRIQTSQGTLRSSSRGKQHQPGMLCKPGEARAGSLLQQQHQQPPGAREPPRPSDARPGLGWPLPESLSRCQTRIA